jgi:hypothetical protein
MPEAEQIRLLFCVLPGEIPAEAFEVGEERTVVGAVPVKRPDDCLSVPERNNYFGDLPLDVGIRLKLHKAFLASGISMNGEPALLRDDARVVQVWPKDARLGLIEGTLSALNLHEIVRRMQDIDKCVFLLARCARKPKGDQGIGRPIQKARRQAIVLGTNKKVPIVLV